MKVFFTDLDRTIIFSNRFVDESQAKNVIPVEEKEGRVISYMNPTSNIYLEVLRRRVAFIPVTARKHDEIMRISFIKNNIPEWMVCESGRVIYHNGERWEDWDFMLEKELKKIKREIEESQNYFRYLLEDKYKVATWHINPDMVMGKTVGMTGEQIAELESYSKWFEDHHCQLHIQQRKAYLIPTPISKSNAVEYLISLLQPKKTVSAGDADMDAGMFEKTDFAIAPMHHTIVDLTVPVTKETGLRAGENILLFAMEKLYQ